MFEKRSIEACNRIARSTAMMKSKSVAEGAIQFPCFLYNAYNVVVVSRKELATDTLDTPDTLNTFSSPRTSASGSTDISLWLQTMIATWKGAQNGLALATRHQECVNAAGPALFHRLLPV